MDLRHGIFHQFSRPVAQFSVFFPGSIFWYLFRIAEPAIALSRRPPVRRSTGQPKRLLCYLWGIGILDSRGSFCFFLVTYVWPLVAICGDICRARYFFASHVIKINTCSLPLFFRQLDKTRQPTYEAGKDTKLFRACSLPDPCSRKEPSIPHLPCLWIDMALTGRRLSGAYYRPTRTIKKHPHCSFHRPGDQGIDQHGKEGREFQHYASG